MQTQNLLEQPRIRHYSLIGSENVFGAVNQQTMQSLAYAMSTLAEEVDCKVSEATNGHLIEMMVWSAPPATDGNKRLGLGLIFPLTATSGKVKACHIDSA